MILKRVLIGLVFLFSLNLVFSATYTNTTAGFKIDFNLYNTTTNENIYILHDFVLKDFDETKYDINYISNYAYICNKIGLGCSPLSNKWVENDNYYFNTFGVRLDLKTDQSQSSANYVMHDFVIKPFDTNLYDINYISNGAYICNKIGLGCSPFSTKFVDGNVYGALFSGMSLKFLPYLYSDPITTPYYLSPTPANNMKKKNTGNLTINISNGGSDINGCIATINNQNYTMNYNNGFCSYNYPTIFTNTTTLNIDFKGYYNLSGTLYSLGERSMTIYERTTNSNTVPVFSILSLLLFLVIIFFR